MNSPDGAWELLHKVVQEAAQEQFPQKAKEDDEYAELTKHRGKLLKQRANLRQVLRGAGPDTEADITLELTMITRRCRKMRQTAAKDKERILILEIWSAWRQRDFSRVHRLRVQLAGKGRGPKKRVYHAAAQGAPTIKEWEEVLEKEGGEGGMKCEQFDWETHKKIPRGNRRI